MRHLFWMLLSVSLARANCTVDDLTNKCEMFKNLDPFDTFTLPSGKKIPACVLSSVHTEQVLKWTARKKAAFAEFSEDLKKVPSEIFSDEFKEHILKQDARPLAVDWERRGDATNEYPGFGHMGAKDFNKKIAPIFEAKGLGDLLERLIKNARASGEEQPRFQPKLTPLVSEPRNKSARMTKTFDTARKGILSYLDGIKLSDADRAQILARIKTIETDTKYSETETPEPCSPANLALYDIEAHRVIVPPSMFHYPDESILRAVAHEITHSFDIYSSKRPLVKFTNDPGRLHPSGKRKAKRTYGFPLPEDTPNRYTVISKGMPGDTSPFEKIWRCLASPEGGGFGSQDMAEKKMNEDDANLEEHSKEAFADWMAAEAAAASLAEIPPAQQKNWAMDFLIFQLDGACAESFKGKTQRSDRNDEHPLWTRRVNEIMLKNEKLRAALGCAPVAQPCKMDPEPAGSRKSPKADGRTRNRASRLLPH